MATASRDFQANLPVMTTARWAYRYRYFAHPEVKRYVMDLIRMYAKTCKVRILAASVVGNHYHLGAIQDFDGISNPDLAPTDAQEGIAPFHRGLNSQSSRQLGRAFSSQRVAFCGRKWDGPYHATPLTSVAELLGYMAYILCQARRHGLPSDAVWSTRGAFDGEATVVNCVPDFTELGETVEERRSALGRLLDAIGDAFLERERQTDREHAEEVRQNARRRRPLASSTLERMRARLRQQNLLAATRHVAEDVLPLQKAAKDVTFLDVEALPALEEVVPPRVTARHCIRRVLGRDCVVATTLRDEGGVECVVRWGQEGLPIDAQPSRI